MVRQTAKTIFLEIVGGFIFLFLLAATFLAVRLSSGPMALPILKPSLIAGFEDMRGGLGVDFEQVTLEWLAEEGQLVLIANNIDFLDEEGQLAAEAERCEVLLSIGGFSLRQIRPLKLRIEGGWVGVAKAGDIWRVAGQPVPISSNLVLPPSSQAPDDFIATLNGWLTQSFDISAKRAASTGLQNIAFENIEMRVLDQDRAVQYRFHIQSGVYSQDMDSLDLALNGESLEADAAPGTLGFRLNMGSGYRTLETELSFATESLAALMRVWPSAPISLTDLPANLTLTLSANAQEGVSALDAAMTLGAGRLGVMQEILDVRGVKMTAAYRPETDQLSAQFEELNIGPVQGRARLNLFAPFKFGKERRFSLISPRLSLDARPLFPQIWRVSQVEVSGVVDSAKSTLKLDNLALRLNEAGLTLKGQMAGIQDAKRGELPLELALTSRVSGPIAIKSLLDYWPESLGPGARRYISSNIRGGVVTEAEADITIGRNSFKQGHLADEALSVTFQAIDVGLQAIPDMPEIKGVTATGTMTGNSVKIDFTDGALQDWQIEGGSVHYPQLHPRGADMIVNIEGRGPAQSLARMVSDSRLQIEARSGFNPDNLSGEGVMRFELIRPAIPNVPISDYRYTGEGEVISGGLKNAFSDLSLTDSNAKVFLNEKGLRVSGFGQIAEAPLQYEWAYAFNSDDGLANLKATSQINSDMLNAVGIPSRAYIFGNAPVELQAKLAGTNIRQLDAAVDLQSLALDVALLDWIKPRGVPARTSLRYQAAPDIVTSEISFNTEEAVFDGTISVQPNGRLISANIEKAYLKDRMDLSGTARRNEADALIIDAAGAFLDMSSFMPNISTIGRSPAPLAVQVGDLTFNARIDRLQWRPDFETQTTVMSLTSTQDGLQTASAIGKLPNSASINLSFDATGLGDPTFLINCDDASFLTNVFFGMDALKGGRLQMTGTLGGQELPTQFRLDIQDTRLVKAPLFARILSVASLRGLSDALSGNGISFSKIEVPITVSKGRYSIVGARAYGPALGLTANGHYTPGADRIDIGGVLVPSFGINSALGGLPIIGDLLVRREGEGVISLRYDVTGSVRQANVSVNLLSAITPGILRGIFDNPETARPAPLANPPQDKPSTIIEAEPEAEISSEPQLETPSGLEADTPTASETDPEDTSISQPDLQNPAEPDPVDSLPETGDPKSPE